MKVLKFLGWATAVVGLLLVGKAATSPQGPLGADEDQYLTGQLLVATPEMSDPRFVQTVIYIIKHDPSGAMGLVVNRPIAKGSIADLLESLEVESEGAKGEIIVHYGGPVELKQGFILHTDDYIGDGTRVVRDGIAVTTTVELLRALSLGKGPRQSLFVFGYAGWAPGQLEAEIKANAWFSISAEKDLIFGADEEKKWRRAMDKRKIKL